MVQSKQRDSVLFMIRGNKTTTDVVLTIKNETDLLSIHSTQKPVNISIKPFLFVTMKRPYVD